MLSSSRTTLRMFDECGQLDLSSKRWNPLPSTAHLHILVMREGIFKREGCLGNDETLTMMSHDFILLFSSRSPILSHLSSWSDNGRKFCLSANYVRKDKEEEMKTRLERNNFRLDWQFWEGKSLKRFFKGNFPPSHLSCLKVWQVLAALSSFPYSYVSYVMCSSPIISLTHKRRDNSKNHCTSVLSLPLPLSFLSIISIIWYLSLVLFGRFIFHLWAIKCNSPRPLIFYVWLRKLDFLFRDHFSLSPRYIAIYIALMSVWDSGFLLFWRLFHSLLKVREKEYHWTASAMQREPIRKKSLFSSWIEMTSKIICVWKTSHWQAIEYERDYEWEVSWCPVLRLDFKTGMSESPVVKNSMPCKQDTPDRKWLNPLLLYPFLYVIHYREGEWNFLGHDHDLPSSSLKSTIPLLFLSLQPFLSRYSEMERCNSLPILIRHHQSVIRHPSPHSLSPSFQSWVEKKTTPPPP